MPPLNLDLPRDSFTRRSTDLKAGDWWILGSTDYAVVDPTRPRTSSDLVRRFERPKQLADDLYDSGWYAASPGSRVFGFPDRTRYSSFRIQQQPEYEGLKGGDVSRALQNKSRYTRDPVADAKAPNLLPSVSRGQSSFISVPARKSSIYVPGGSSTNVTYHANVPSFRAIVKQMQEDSQRRRPSEISILSPEGQSSTARIPSIYSANTELTISFTRNSSSGIKDELNPRSGTGSISSMSSTDSVYHKLARERLKRSFTRLASRMSTSVSRGQVEESDADVPPKGDGVDPAVTEVRQQTVTVLKQLEENAHLVHKEMRNLQRAAEVAEELASQVKPELEAKKRRGGSLKMPSGPRDRLGIGNLQVFGLEIVEPHAAMTDTQLQEVQKAAEAAREQRQNRLEALKRLQDHLTIARECQEKFRRAPPSTISAAFNTFDMVAGHWSSWDPHAPLLLPVALAALACTMAYDVCATGSTEVAAQTLASLLFHTGSGKAAEKMVKRSLRHSAMHDSMLEHKALVERMAVKMLALVLDHDARSSRRASSQLQVPRGERSAPVLTSTQDGAKDPTGANAPKRACFFNIVSVAQEAILAIHEAGGRRGKPVSLEREAERNRDPRISRNERALLVKLEFAFLELRLLLNRLMALRLALSELGCTQHAWERINEFNVRVADFLGDLKHTGTQVD
ncbi:uncharacterized protein EMH_0065030 [Eimeria mitis]|uniref:Uncharacterized protein n=1 Tax=Eimeria mitis TaxID=44415 RepID=U6KIP2_9EIME|nr:uncharacterized protein EMH_0065030 [Eimeria mitis]CDJ36137.1 hypothetical protein, conserved [Eimeria mitis]